MSTVKTKPVRLLIVDDHQVLRVGLRTLLSQDRSVHIVGDAATAESAIRQAEKLKPDLILMDIRLPDGSGVDACRDILESSPNTRVIFLTSYADDDSVLAAVLAGASGYVLKELDSDSLLHVIHSVAAGRSVLDPSVTERVLRWLRGFSSGQQIPGVVKLSTQEERVLALVAEGKTNKEIASALALSDKTVKNYLTNMYQKLRITRRAQAAAFFVKRQN